MKNSPALKAGLLLALGIWLDGRAAAPPEVWFGVLAFLMTANLVIASRRGGSGRPAGVALAALWIAIGGLRHSQAVRPLPPGHVGRIAECGGRVRLRGTLKRDPVARADRLELEIECLEIAGETGPFVGTSGRALANSDTSPARLALRYGDTIEWSGRLAAPQGVRNPGGFDYQAWLGRKGIHAVVKTQPSDTLRVLGRGGGNPFLARVVYPLRRFGFSVIDSESRGQSRALLRSLVLGDQGLVSPDLREDFSRTGIVHILSVSGSHVAFLFLILSTLLGALRLSGAGRTAAVVAGLAVYAMVTDSNAPVVRAAVMASAFCVGRQIERETDAVQLLGVAGLVLLLLSPQDLFDPGFQLSFLSVASIVLLYPRLRDGRPFAAVLKNKSSPASVRTLIAASLVSVAAQIGTLPVTAAYYNWIPLVSIPANLVAAPLTGLIMALSIAVIALAGVCPAAAAAYASLDRLLAVVFIKTAETAAALPFACLTVPSPSASMVAAAYGILLALLCRPASAWRRRFVFAALMLANASVWPRALRPGPAVLKWIQFDVGQGDAALIRTPSGKTLLIDGGGGRNPSDCGRRIVMPYLNRNGVRKIDVAVLTHSHADHIAGLLSILPNCRIGLLVVPDSDDSSSAFRTLMACAKSRGIPVKKVAGADSLSGFGSMRAFVVNPAPWIAPESGNRGVGSNEHSLVTLICYGRVKWLFMGDAGTQSEAALMHFPLVAGCDVVKIGHHGSKYASSSEFIRFTSPRTAVCSVGANNRFGHPCPDVLSRFAGGGASVIRTDLEGAAWLESDGVKTWIHSWRNDPGSGKESGSPGL
jgi:competence protein ComEC